MNTMERLLQKPAMPVLMLVLGIILIIWPGMMLTTVVRLAGVVLLLGGASALIQGIKTKDSGSGASSNLILGALVAIVGLYMLISPKRVVNLFPTVAGIAIIFKGLYDLLQVWQLKKSGYQNWVPDLAMACVTVILGIILLSNPFGTMKTLVRILGVVLVYNGATSMWISTR